MSISNFSIVRELGNLKLIEVAPRVGFLTFRSNQRTAFSSDILSLPQLIFLFNCWLDFFVQGILLVFFWWSKKLSKIDFVSCVGIKIVQKCQNAKKIDECPNSNFLQDYRPDHFGKIPNLNDGSIGAALLGNTIPSSPALHTWRTRNSRIVFKMGSVWYLDSCFSTSTGILFSFKFPIKSVPHLLE